MKNWFPIFCFFLVFFFGKNTFAQSKIDYKSDRSIKNEEKYPGAFIMSKVSNQVYFYHEGIKVWCDLAIFYKQENFFKAFGNVRMMQGDTITLNSEYAEYNGNTKFAFASNNVHLQTPNNTLTTDSLFFNRKKQQAYYRSGGTLKDSVTTITSKIGRYYMKDEKYSFVTDVVVTNPEYYINTEQLDFYNETGHAYLYGPSTITSETNKIYCERGFYDTRGDVGYFVKNSTIYYKNRKLEGDSIYFDRDSGFASATNHIKVTDTANNTIVTGHYAQVYKKKDSVFITKRALISTLQGKDSMFVHSDTIMITGKPEKRVVRGFYDVRLYSETMSGKSDSIYINEANGITKMLGKPVVWSGAGQITGDTIHLLNNVKTDKLDSLRVFENAFIIQKDSIKGFNQVKGKRMFGLFENNELYEVNLIQNTETIYYLRNSETELIGIDKTLSSSIKLLLKNREITDVIYNTNAEGVLYQETELPENARILKGFIWRGEEKLNSKEDLFLNDPPLNLPKIKGIELPEAKESFFDKGEEEGLLLNEKSRLFPKKLEPQKRDSLNRKKESLKNPIPYLKIPDSKIDSLKTSMVKDSLPKLNNKQKISEQNQKN